MNERILHLKNALNAIYENANKLDIYNFNTAEIKELVNKYDTELNEYFEDSNKSGGVQFKRKKIINFSLLEKDIYSLHSKTFQYLSSLYIYETLDRIESEIDSYNEETYKYNADKCLFDLQVKYSSDSGSPCFTSKTSSSSEIYLIVLLRSAATSPITDKSKGASKDTRFSSSVSKI